MIATYDDYQNVYGGTVIPSLKFNSFSIQAENYINQITNDQASDAANNAKIKMAICAVADAIYTNQGRDGITSESVSGASQTYDLQTIKSAKRNAAKIYLGQTGLMYMGV